MDFAFLLGYFLGYFAAVLTNPLVLVSGLVIGFFCPSYRWVASISVACGLIVYLFHAGEVMDTYRRIGSADPVGTAPRLIIYCLAVLLCSSLVWGVQRLFAKAFK